MVCGVETSSATVNHDGDSWKIWAIGVLEAGIERIRRVKAHSKRGGITETNGANCSSSSTHLTSHFGAKIHRSKKKKNKGSEKLLFPPSHFPFSFLFRPFSQYFTIFPRPSAGQRWKWCVSELTPLEQLLSLKGRVARPRKLAIFIFCLK